MSTWQLLQLLANLAPGQHTDPALEARYQEALAAARAHLAKGQDPAPSLEYSLVPRTMR